MCPLLGAHFFIESEKEVYKDLKDQKKKKLPLRQTLSNNLFALKVIWEASPIYLSVYLGFDCVAVVKCNQQVVG